MNQSNEKKITLLKKFIYCFFALIGFPFVTVIGALSFANVNKEDNAAEIKLLTSIIEGSYIVFPIIMIILTIIWHIKDKNKTSNLKGNKVIVYYCITLCRYILSAIVMFYGFSKLLVDQLSMSYYWYGDELGKLSGYQLTWSFFGYSKFYSTTIAIAQIIGGMLLLFRKTTLLGALFLLPILINITLIDYNYDIPAKDIITVLLFMTIFLFSLSINPLLSFFIKNKIVDGAAIVSVYSSVNKYPKFLKPLIVSGTVLFAFMTNYNQINTSQKSPFEGAWEAVKVNNYTDSIAEKNKNLTLRLFFYGNTATIKKTYQYEDFRFYYDASAKNTMSLTKSSDSVHFRDIHGHYKLIDKNRLIFSGRDGRDSVYWVLKKTSK